MASDPPGAQSDTWKKRPLSMALTGLRGLTAVMFLLLVLFLDSPGTLFSPLPVLTRSRALLSSCIAARDSEAATWGGEGSAWSPRPWPRTAICFPLAPEPSWSFLSSLNLGTRELGVTWAQVSHHLVGKMRSKLGPGAVMASPETQLVQGPQGGPPRCSGLV